MKTSLMYMIDGYFIYLTKYDTSLKYLHTSDTAQNVDLGNPKDFLII